MTFWNLKNEVKKATIEVYGYIGRWLDVDEREFSMQLKAVGDKDLDVYVNSDGGSVYTAITIYNMLARHTGKVTIYVDGAAMSAATIITSVPNAKVIMPVGSMMMIHSPSHDPGGNIDAKEMRRIADVLDKVGGSIGGIYKLKTNLDDDKIQNIMEDETYLTALEAVDLGFADEVAQQMNVAASLSRDRMIVNGLDIDSKRHKNMPDSWLNSGTIDTGNSAGDDNEHEEVKSMNLEKLKADNPELYNQVLAEGEQAGVKTERNRIKAIEDMAMSGHEKLITAAKFETGITAEALAVDLIKAEKQRKSNILSQRKNDAADVSDLGDDSIDASDIDPEAAKDHKQRKTWLNSAKRVSKRNSIKGE